MLFGLLDLALFCQLVLTVGALHKGMTPNGFAQTPNKNVAPSPLWKSSFNGSQPAVASLWIAKLDSSGTPFGSGALVGHRAQPQPENPLNFLGESFSVLLCLGWDSLTDATSRAWECHCHGGCQRAGVWIVLNLEHCNDVDEVGNYITPKLGLAAIQWEALLQPPAAAQRALALIYSYCCVNWKRLAIPLLEINKMRISHRQVTADSVFIAQDISWSCMVPAHGLSDRINCKRKRFRFWAWLLPVSTWTFFSLAVLNKTTFLWWGCWNKIWIWASGSDFQFEGQLLLTRIQARTFRNPLSFSPPKVAFQFLLFFGWKSILILADDLLLW